MNTLEPPEGGFDLFLTDLGDRYFVEVGSDAGVQDAPGRGAVRPGRPEDHKAKQAYDKVKAGNFPKKLPYDTRYLPDLLDASYDSLLWEAISRRCFSCGTCTNVCPTCFCFDVQDKLDLDAASGIRQRRWDSCQLQVFAEVAGGENFREHRASRTRHRMFRKGKYILERTGRIGCVGCGRCIRHCVANISILEAFQQIAGEAAEVMADRGQEITRTIMGPDVCTSAENRVGALPPPRGPRGRRPRSSPTRRLCCAWSSRTARASSTRPVSSWRSASSARARRRSPSAPGRASAHDLEMCVRAVGDVTKAIHRLTSGRRGGGFAGRSATASTWTTVAGMDLLFVAGGLGLAPCRSFIQAALDQRDKFSRVTILYGARTPGDLLFRDDLEAWADAQGLRVHGHRRSRRREPGRATPA